jgi:hypothetical protein
LLVDVVSILISSVNVDEQYIYSSKLLSIFCKFATAATAPAFTLQSSDFNCSIRSSTAGKLIPYSFKFVSGARNCFLMNLRFGIINNSIILINQFYFFLYKYYFRIIQINNYYNHNYYFVIQFLDKF